MQKPFSAAVTRALDALLSSSAGGGIAVNNHIQDRASMRSQIDALAPVFEFVALEDLAAACTRKKGRPFCLFTFDDGKRVNLEAAEVLNAAGISAAFFVCTDYVGGAQALWFDELAALRRCDPRALQRFGLLQPKNLPFRVLRSRLDAALSSVDVEINLDDPKVGAMSWDDVRSLVRKGFTVGAHGRSHAILTNERFEDASEDIQESIAEVARQLRVPCRSFAFPNGNYNESLAAVAFAAGGDFLFTTEPVWIGRREAETALFPRIQLHEKQGPVTMKAKLLAARPGFILKDPNGTGYQYVNRAGFTERSRHGANKS